MELIGWFAGWEDIPGSVDKYLLVQVPDNPDPLKVRLTFTPQPVQPNTDPAGSIYMQDLNRLITDKELVRIQYGQSSNMGWLAISDLIKPGQIISILVQGSYETGPELDTNGMYQVHSLNLRKI